jgi:hypothetical protein
MDVRKARNACLALTNISPSNEHSLSSQLPVATTALKQPVCQRKICFHHRNNEKWIGLQPRQAFEK